MTIQEARTQAEKFITNLQARTQALTEGDGQLATQLRRALASEQAAAARKGLESARSQAHQAIKAGSAQWERFAATPAGAQVKAAHEKLSAFAKRFATAE